MTTAVGALALAPHVAWLIAHDFAPFSYAVAVHGAASAASTLRGTLGYLGGSVAYVVVPLVLVVAMARPRRAAVTDMAWPTPPARRLAALAFWATLLGPALIAPFTRVHLVSIWAMSAYALLPVMLLSSPLVAIARGDAVRALALAAGFPLVMVAVAPAIAFGLHRGGLFPSIAHSSVLVEPIEKLWRETTDRPLQVFGGYDELTDGVSFYLPTHPLAAHVLDSTKPPDIAERIGRDGIVLLCPMLTRHPPSAEWCVQAASQIADRFPPGVRREIEVSRRYLGVEGRPARYLVITIPPLESEKPISLREPAADFAASHFRATE